MIRDFIGMMYREGLTGSAIVNVLDDTTPCDATPYHRGYPDHAIPSWAVPTMPYHTATCTATHTIECHTEHYVLDVVSSVHGHVSATWCGRYVVLCVVLRVMTRYHKRNFADGLLQRRLVNLPHIMPLPDTLGSNIEWSSQHYESRRSFMDSNNNQRRTHPFPNAPCCQCHPRVAMTTVSRGGGNTSALYLAALDLRHHATLLLRSSWTAKTCIYPFERITTVYWSLAGFWTGQIPVANGYFRVGS